VAILHHSATLSEERVFGAACYYGDVFLQTASEDQSEFMDKAMASGDYLKVQDSLTKFMRPAQDQ